MTTRQQIQIAQDLVRFVNIMNDLLDCASWILKEVDPQLGNKLQVRVPHEMEDTGPPVFRDATLEELKERGKRAGQNVLGYRNTINQFISRYGANNVRTALTSIGIDIADIQNDVAKMEAEARNLNNFIENAQSKAELLSFAESIDNNIPKLTLVRRSWCLGV